MRLAIVVSKDWANFLPDDRPLVDALRARGVEAIATVWDDASVDWASFDALVIRTPWDYYKRIDEFLPWLDRVESLGCRIVNPPKTLRWNADKRYLRELEANGWDVVPTRWVERGAAMSLVDLIAATGWEEAVFKPAVSGGAWKTVRFLAGDASAHEATFRALVSEDTVLVQPYLREIERDGEWSLLFFGGEFSHAVLKKPKQGDFRVQPDFGGVTVREEPPAVAIEAARAGLARLPQIGHDGVLYARVDGVIVDGVFRLMELELIEPRLFLGERPEAGAMYAEVLIAALG